MKKIIISLVMIICACAMIFTGCSSKGLKDNPPTDALVIGNGGYAIQKGDYLYYINGYVDKYTEELTDYKKDNVEGEVVYGAIYRTKLVNGQLSKDAKGFLNTSECVVSKVVGYEQGGFYIVGDYIYYATPYMRVDSNGVIQNTRISFNRINIDGTKNKEMYVTEEGATDIDWRINVFDNKTYLVVKQTVTEESDSLSQSETKTTVTSVLDKGKKFTKTVVADNVTEVVFNEDVNLSSEYFYYTRSVKDGEKAYSTSGNLICKASIVNGGEVAYELDKVSTYGLVALANGRLYVTKQNSNTKTYLYNFNANENLINQNPIKLSNAEYSNYYTIEGVPHSIVALKDSSLVRINNVGNQVQAPQVLADSVTNVVCVNEGYVYYYDSNVLYRISILDGSKQTVSEVGEFEGKTFFIESADMVDVDGKYIYFFAQYNSADGNTTSYYLNRVNGETTDLVAEFVGVMIDSHMVAAPEVEDGESVENTAWV